MRTIGASMITIIGARMMMEAVDIVCDVTLFVMTSWFTCALEVTVISLVAHVL
jgi:hypothetical protein